LKRSLVSDPAIQKPFTLLSCFKWEERKGWDVLLAAYLQVGGAGQGGVGVGGLAGTW
jgi:hypothetical protein